MESTVHEMIWFQSSKHCFYFWNEFKILTYFNLQKPPPWKLKFPPESGERQIRFAP